VAIFFYSMYFPFSYRSLEMSGRISHVHYILIATGLAIPFILVIAIMGNHAAVKPYVDSNLTYWESGAGFTPVSIPPVVCATSPGVQYYAFVLLFNLVFALGCVLLFMVLWLVMKVSYDATLNVIAN